MSQLSNFDDLLKAEVPDLYSAEKQFLKALPKVAKAASNTKLQQALEKHVGVTEKQIDRLEKIAAELGVKLNGKKCIGAEAIVKEGEEMIKEGGDPDVLDAGLIGAAQRMEHYEIAGYGTLAALAKRVGNKRAAELAAKTLDEERDADEKLSQIAERSVNEAAAQA